MTLSQDVRKQGIRDALRVMLEGLGEHAFDEIRFEVASQGEPVDSFKEIPWPTTWEDLEGRGYITRMYAIGSQGWRLTGAGWIAAMKATKKLDMPQQQDAIVRLRRALVDANKGRPPQGTLTSEVEIAAAAGLALGWVTSAIRSQLLTDRFPNDQMRLIVQGRTIRIPPRFASEAVDVDPDE